MSYTIQVITDQGSVNVECRAGERTLLSDALQRAGISQDRPCGGRGKCGKCTVRVSGVLSPVTEAERHALTEEQLAAGLRLACLAYALDTVTIYYNTQNGDMQGVTKGFLTDFSICPPRGATGTGLAVDIGTTTVAAYLYDLASGELLGSLCQKNPQRAHGADVISRVDYGMHGGLDTLQKEICDCIDSMSATLCAVGAHPTPTLRVIAGNTAMLHLLTATDPSPLAAAPFVIRRPFGEWTDNDTTYLPRCISAFVGADITCALLSSGICRDKSHTVLLMDVGTNGEMALWHKGELLCCSTAAGPALEGAGISCGAMAVTGAISRVDVVDGEMVCEVIGGKDTPAIGLCGTGLIDAVAALLGLELLDETGYLEDDVDVGGSGCVLTGADIRQVQLAKSAIRAGLETLLHVAGIGYDELDELALAGGFGSYLHPDSCADIGLIPHELVGKIRVLGNAAGSGASMILLSDKELAHSEQIAAQAKTVDLSTSPVFMEKYVDYMYF